MKHLKQFNESKEEIMEAIVVKIFTLIGFDVDDDGIVTCKTKLARYMSDMLVREGKFEKIEHNKYKAKV